MMHRRTLLGLAATLPLITKAYAETKPRLATIGAGQVGSTLGSLWVKAGYHVTFSARTLSEAQEIAQPLGPLASAATPAQAAASADIVLLAVPYRAIPQLGHDLATALNGKIVLDATNPYSFRDGPIAATAQQNGAGPTTQSYFPGARIVRGFNSIDMSSIQSNAHRSPPELAIPIAGNDPAALKTIAQLVHDTGFDPVITGNLTTAKLFQPGNPGFEMEQEAPGLKAALHLPSNTP